MSRSLVFAHLALLAVNFIYAANYLVAKGIMPDHVQPSGFIFIRVIGALPLFWLIRLFVREKVAKKDFGRLVLCGLFGVTINQLFFFNGLNLTSPVDAAIIMTSTPILVLIIASILIKEAITKQKLVGVLLGAAGAITLILYGASEQSKTSSIEGNLMVLANAISYGVYLVTVKPLMSKYNPITVISWVFFFGFLFMAPVGYGQFTEIDWNSMSTTILWGVFYVVIGTTFFAYLLNIFALSIVSPTVSSSYIYLQPVTVMILTAIFTVSASDTSSFSWVKIGCTLLIFLGVYLVSRPNLKKA